MTSATRICSTCNSPKDLNRFQKRSYLIKTGEVKVCYLSECKDCRNVKDRENNPNTKDKRKNTRAVYYKTNKEKVRAKSNIYYQENKSKILAYQKDYQSLNKDKVRESKRKSEMKRFQNDPAFKLRKRVSAQVRDHLKRFDSSKGGESILKYLGYTLEELRFHLESKFELWMTWDNYGSYNSKLWKDNNTLTWTWQIDHIIPQYKLPYQSMNEDNFKICWALDNLRPLSSKQNLLDGVCKVR